jgi:hypothetical protein
LDFPVRRIALLGIDELASLVAAKLLKLHDFNY